jgi:hypothetical protein
MITLAITAIAAGVAAFTVRHAVETRPGFESDFRTDLR